MFLNTVRRLPKTISLLNSFVETDEEVNIRRIQWATKKLTSEGESITFVKIRKRQEYKRNF